MILWQKANWPQVTVLHVEARERLRTQVWTQPLVMLAFFQCLTFFLSPTLGLCCFQSPVLLPPFLSNWLIFIQAEFLPYFSQKTYLWALGFDHIPLLQAFGAECKDAFLSLWFTYQDFLCNSLMWFFPSKLLAPWRKGPCLFLLTFYSYSLE